MTVQAHLDKFDAWVMDMRKLFADVAQHLGGSLKPFPSEHRPRWCAEGIIEMPMGVRLTLRVDESRKGKLRAWWTLGNDLARREAARGMEVPCIGMSVGKSTKAIAADILRRLIPPATECEVALDRILAADEARKQRLDDAEARLAALGFESPERCSAYSRRMKASMGGTRITLDFDSAGVVHMSMGPMPLDVAERVLATLRDSIGQGDDE